ncbi:MAG TPA: response regulator [Rudaea sp.]|nr:response regulator [Rudaea sp.]
MTNTEASGARRILIVEDDPTHATLLAETLAAEGFGADVLADGASAVERVRAAPPAAVLLDLTLPGKDGFSVCREIRAFSTVPLIMVTARVEEIDRLLGLEIGADDYICKPFQPREVVARVRALLRRTVDWRDPGAGALLAFDDAAHAAHWKGTALDLTAVEFRLLKTLAERPGRVLSRANLLDAIYLDYRIVNDRTVDSHIKNLRRKIAEAEPGANPIESVYGVGYRYLGESA